MAFPWTAVIGGYAAGVSTIVALRQMLVELPSVRIQSNPDAVIIGPLEAGKQVHAVAITNVGRWPVTITFVGFLPSDGFMSMPGVFSQELPFTLHEAEQKSLKIDLEIFDIPGGATFFARDNADRWWPRRRRVRVRLRGWRLKFLRRRKARTGRPGD